MAKIKTLAVDEFYTPTLAEVISALQSGDISSEQLTRKYAARINELNSFVKAVSQANPDALQNAIALDKERASGHVRGPLHGVPILIKETMCTLDRMHTTAGSFALVGARPSTEASVVRRLRDAGAVILGKTNVTEWSNSRSPHAPNGWSALYGQCYGAFFGSQDPEGSSSGCAVAMSIGLAAAAVGVEAWGDITHPAERNGVVGLKPTVGLVSRAAVIPVSSYKDTMGPITRTVKDAAIVLSAIAGRCILDRATDPIPFETIPDYVAACKPGALRGARIAVSPSVMERYPDQDIVQAIEAALQVMELAGAEIVRNFDLVGWDYGVSKRVEMPGNIMLREGLESYFSSLATNPHGIYTMADLVDFLAMMPAENVDSYGFDGFIKARDEPHNSSSPEFKAELYHMVEQGGAILKMLDQANCNALVVPTKADIPSDLGHNPVIAVPLGFRPSTTKALRSSRMVPTDPSSQMIGKGPNSPYSLSFVGRRFSEEKLISLAYAFEQKTNVLAKSRPCVRSTVPVLSGPCPSCRDRIHPPGTASKITRGGRDVSSK